MTTKVQEMTGLTLTIFVFALFFAGFAPSASAQGANDPRELRGNIDNQESGVLAEGAEASSSIAQSVVGALRDEAQRDLGIVVKTGQNTPIFTPTPVIAARASAAPTLDASDASIERDIERLQRDARAEE